MRSTSVTSTPARLSFCAAASPPNPPPTITTRRRPLPSRDMSGFLVDARAEALEQVVAHAQPVRHRRERRVHGADAREEARVDDVEVVDLVRATVDVQHR